MSEQPIEPRHDDNRQKNLHTRVHDFLEHPYLQTVLSVVGGLLGALVDGRWLLLLFPWVSFALVRSKALEATRIRTVIVWHSTLSLVAVVLLFGCGVLINRHRTSSLTESELKSTLDESLSKHHDVPPSGQTPSSPPLPHTEAAELEAKVFITPWEAKGQDNTGFLYEAYAENVGDEAALHRITTSGYYVEDKTAEGEKRVFDAVAASFKDRGPTAPRPMDMAPGTDSKTSVQVRVPFLEGDDLLGFENGTLGIYLFEVDLYRDEKGREYRSELCMISDSTAPKLYFCRGHNGHAQLTR